MKPNRCILKEKGNSGNENQYKRKFFIREKHYSKSSGLHDSTSLSPYNFDDGDVKSGLIKKIKTGKENCVP